MSQEEFPYFQVVVDKLGRAHAKGVAQASLGHSYDGPDPSIAEGVYANWTWDGTQLEACVDHLGFYSLFYCGDGDGVKISPSLLQLLANGAPAEFDDAALGVFFNIGFFLNEETPFAGIKVLPPNGKLVWRAGSLVVTGGVEVPPESRTSRSQAIEGFTEMFRASMRRAIASCAENYVVPLSGGRDSRHILLEMKALNQLPASCITYNYRTDGLDAEATSAKLLAEAVGVKHEILGGSKSPLRDNLRALIFTSLCSDEHFQMTPLRDYAIKHAPLCAFDGIGGDVLSRSKGLARVDLHEMCRRGQWRDVAADFVNGHRSLVRWSADHEMNAAEADARFGKDAAIDRIAEALSAFEAAPHPVTAFLLNNRTRREISFVSTAVLSPAKVLCPFLDHQLVTFLKSLPAEVTSDAKLHETLIREVYPEYAQVPFWDELKLKSGGRHSVLHRLRTMSHAIRAMSSVSGSLGLSELLNQARMIYDRERRHQYIHRLYFVALNASRDARSAKRFLNALTTMEAVPV